MELQGNSEHLELFLFLCSEDLACFFLRILEHHDVWSERQGLVKKARPWRILTGRAILSYLSAVSYPRTPFVVSGFRLRYSRVRNRLQFGTLNDFILTHILKELLPEDASIPGKQLLFWD